MKILADIVMLIWPVVVLALFVALPPRRAVLAGYIAGWLFLPLSSYELPLFPDFTKMSATTCAVFLAVLIFDSPRVARFRFRWFDLPAIVYCASPWLTSIVNGLGAYDGLSAIVTQVLAWGLPYFIGRLYFNDSAGIRELAVAIFIGGLIYIPFCLFEIRMSPQLAPIVYGDPGRSYNAIRFGGYRPRVFMIDGLMLGMWMTITSLVGFWLWWTKAVSQVRGISMYWLAPLLVAVSIMCRSTGAILLLATGIVVLVFSKTTKTRLAIWCLLAVTPFYISTRIVGIWDGAEITTWAGKIDQDRAQSFQFRLDNEDILISKAMQRPLVGWGTWGRNRVFDDWGRDISVTDGRWIIELGQRGLIGMASLFSALLLPLALLIVRVPKQRLLSDEFAPEIVLGMVVVLYAIDSLPNAMANPVLMLVAGAVVSRAAANHAIEPQTSFDMRSVDRKTARTSCQNVAQRKLNPGNVR